MKILKAKIKKGSSNYHFGLNQKGKPIWLLIVDFNSHGEQNFKIRAIKGIKNGFAEYMEIWVKPDEITIKHQEDGQLTLDIFSPQEKEENRNNPRYYNQRRFEINTDNEKYYLYGPDYESVEKEIKQFCNGEFSIKQVKRLSRDELKE
jgi:hypothetical protein